MSGFGRRSGGCPKGVLRGPEGFLESLFWVTRSGLEGVCWVIRSGLEGV